jgi:hypothetical protein
MMDRTRFLVMGTASWILAIGVGMTLASLTGSDALGLVAAFVVAFGPMLFVMARSSLRASRGGRGR